MENLPPEGPKNIYFYLTVAQVVKRVVCLALWFDPYLLLSICRSVLGQENELQFAFQLLDMHKLVHSLLPVPSFDKFGAQHQEEHPV